MTKGICFSHSYETSHSSMHIGIIKYSQFCKCLETFVLYILQTKNPVINHIEHNSDFCLTTEVHISCLIQSFSRENESIHRQVYKRDTKM